MIGARARHLFEEIVVGQRLDHANRHAVLCKRKRQGEPDRACPDDDYFAGRRQTATDPLLSSLRGQDGGALLQGRMIRVQVALGREHHQARLRRATEGLSQCRER